MNDPIFLRTGQCAALATLVVLMQAAPASAQITAPRHLPPVVVPPAPPTADKDADESASTAPAPQPVRRPPAIRQPAPAQTTAPAPTPAPVSAPPPIRRAPPVAAPAAAPAAATPQAGTAPVIRARPVATTPQEGTAPVRPRPVATPVPVPPSEGGPRILLPPSTAAQPVRPQGGGSTAPRPAPQAPPVRPTPMATQPRIVALPTELLPPADARTQTVAGSTTLRPGSFSDLVKQMPVVREMSAAQLRVNPMVAIGKTQLDFRKMIDSPTALINVADRLGKMPDLVEVLPGRMTAFETKNGVLVRDFLSYRIKPGVCGNAGARTRLEATGVSCFTRSSAADMDGGYARPGDIRYVKDPVQRAKALAEARARRQQMTQEIDKNIADFRQRLANPAQRAELAAEVGEAEVARLAALDDTALAGELMNNSDNMVEQVFYVPAAPAPQPPAAPAPPPAPQSKDVAASYPLDRQVYLTGFTMGRDFEWKERVQTTIKWCLVGCKSTYYAEAYAGFGYAFGLRFPIQLTGTYDYAKKDGVETASVTTNITPINGGPADYAASGLAANHIYAGKELVAGFHAYAGVSAKLPVVGTLGTGNIGIDEDLTTYLPGDFANGQFTPPAPGKPGPSAPFILEQLDILGGAGNFGVLGAKVFPAVNVELKSNLLSLKLVDKFGSKQVDLTAGVKTVPLTLRNSAAEFLIQDPKYGIQFKLTPGINARLFIDLAVWSKKVDWPVWFPQLAVTIPSDGLTFGCHDGTVCSHEFRFTPKGTQSVFMGKVEQWGRDYDALWRPKCLDDSCLFGLGLARNIALFEARKKDFDDPKGDTNALYQSMTPWFSDAFKRAQTYVTDSQARKSEALSNALGIWAAGYYTQKCLDTLCFDNVTALSRQMGPRAAAIAKANPSLGTTAINAQVNKEFGPKFQKEIDDSKVRDQLAQAQAVRKQMPGGTYMPMPPKR